MPDEKAVTKVSGRDLRPGDVIDEAILVTTTPQSIERPPAWEPPDGVDDPGDVPFVFFKMKMLEGVIERDVMAYGDATAPADETFDVTQRDPQAAKDALAEERGALRNQIGLRAVRLANEAGGAVEVAIPTEDGSREVDVIRAIPGGRDRPAEAKVFVAIRRSDGATGRNVDFTDEMLEAAARRIAYQEELVKTNLRRLLDEPEPDLAPDAPLDTRFVVGGDGFGGKAL